MSILRQFIVILVLAGLAGAAWYLGRPGMQETARQGRVEQAASVLVRPVVTGQERVRLEAVGTARAQQSVTLYPEAAGEVIAVDFTADQMVEAGQVLVRLKQDAEQLSVDLAQVQLTDAERTFARLEKLSATGTTTVAALDEARTALQSARIALQQARLTLADRTIRAPFDGRIGLTEIEVGDRIDASTAIATLDDRAALLIRFSVPEALLGRIVPGTPVQVSPWTGSALAEGVVSDVDSRIDAETRTFPVRAEIPNSEDRFRPGMSFRITLDLIGADRPAIPEIALQWGSNGSFVWVLRDDVARRASVAIVQRQAEGVLVEGDITQGDLVVVEGLHQMREGRSVTYQIEDAPLAADGSS